MSDTGDLIKKLRNEKNFSQRKLAELCGMSYSHICRLEKGENVPTLDTLTKISNALGVLPSVFTFKNNGEVSDIVEQYVKQVTDEEANVFCDLIKFVNHYHCNDNYDLSTLINGDNFNDMKDIVIDVVKSRLNNYKQKENK